MKIKLVLTAIVFGFIQNISAQEMTPSDSLKMEKERIEQQLKVDKAELKDRQKAEDDAKKLEKDQKNFEKDQKKLEREQKKFEKEQKRMASAEKSVAKLKSKLASAQKDLNKKMGKHNKALTRGKLSPVEIEKQNVAISKQQLKIKEIEEEYTDKGYGDFKKGLSEVVVQFIQNFQDKYYALSDGQVMDILEDGRQRAEKIAQETLGKARRAIGVR